MKKMYLTKAFSRELGDEMVKLSLEYLKNKIV